MATEIDWPYVESLLRKKLSVLFIAPPNPQPRFELVFWIDLNGGLNFDVYQRLPGDKLFKFGNLIDGWRDDIEALDSAFVSLVEVLLRKEDFDSVDQIQSRLRDVVRSECNTQVSRNFGYPSGTVIRWRIQDELPRPSDFP